MADFAIWVTAAEGTLGWEPGAFMNAYAGNRSVATELALDDDPVAVAVLKLVEEEDEWSGTSTELLARLGSVVDEEIKRSRSWPTAGNALSNRLKRIAPALREAGIEYEERTQGRAKRRIKTLRKRPSKTVRTVRTARHRGREPQPDTFPSERSTDAAGGSRLVADDPGSEDGPSNTASTGHTRDSADGADDGLRPSSEALAETSRKEGRGVDT